MLKTRSDQYVAFEHYLQVRTTVKTPRSKKGSLKRRTLFAAFSAGSLAFFHANPALIGVTVGLVPFWGVQWWRTPAAPTADPDLELLVRADQAAKVFNGLSEGRRLKGSLHPGIGAVLNECAGAWRRIIAANQSRVWKRDLDRAEYWNTCQSDWTRAADLAMAEALILGESSITFKGPRSKTEEVIEEVVGHFTSFKRENTEPLPPEFRDLREIADNLRSLAKEVESIGETLRIEAGTKARPAASKRLEDVLGQMRAIRTAEEELRQHSGA